MTREHYRPQLPPPNPGDYLEDQAGTLWRVIRVLRLATSDEHLPWTIDIETPDGERTRMRVARKEWIRWIHFDGATMIDLDQPDATETEDIA